jgi:hypothetical protein
METENLLPCPYCGDPMEVWADPLGAVWTVSHKVEGCPVLKKKDREPKLGKEAAVTSWNNFVTQSKGRKA